MSKGKWIALLVGLAASWWMAARVPDSLFRSLWPAIIALAGIFVFRHAVLGLACGVAAGALLVAEGSPAGAVREAVAGQIFPAMQGSWRIGALVFTLLL